MFQINFDFRSIFDSRHDKLHDRVPQFVTRFVQIREKYDSFLDWDKDLRAAIINTSTEKMMIDGKWYVIHE